MVRAFWKGSLLAESDLVIRLEGVNYFPHAALKQQYFTESERHSVCPVKGTANYYHLDVGGEHKDDAAFYFPNPNPRVKSIQNYVGFGEDIEIREE